MNLLSMIASLRKFGNFVVGLFPVLGTILDWLLAPLIRAARVIQARVVKPTNSEQTTGSILGNLSPAPEQVDKFLKAPLVKAATPAIRRFYWKDYAQDRLVLERLPPGSLVILRPLFLVTVALTILLPLLAVFSKPAVDLTTLAGATGSAPIWSVYLWLVAAALAWGCILSGSAFCNRIFFCFVAVIYVILFGACALFIPRSYGNALLPIVVFLALNFSERTLKKPAAVDGILSVLVALVVGAPTGVYLLALTPLQPLFKPFVLESGIVIGALFALSITTFTRGRGGHFEKIPSSSGLGAVRLSALLRQPISISASALILSVITLVFLMTLISRGGAAAFAGQLLSEMSLWNGYLWPVWYFIGIGIVFKLIKNTKVITKSIKEALPGALYLPVVVLLLVVGSVLMWRNDLVNWALPYDYLSAIAVPFYKGTKWYWSESVNSFSAGVLKWVFLFDLIAMVWLLAKKRFHAESAASLLYFSALCCFAVTEYMFQWLSFGRSPGHSVILLMTFAMWLLWLFHTVGLEMSLQTSKTFPSIGRLAIFGSIVLFALLEIHARCAIKDYGVMNQICLYMFRGIIDVGLPYFLYVFASRRFQQLPLKIAEIFQIFCAGAILTYPLNVLDKLALGGWSLPRLSAIWQDEITTFTNKGFIAAQEPALSLLSIALRSAVFVAALASVALLVSYQRKLSNGTEKNTEKSTEISTQESTKNNTSGDTTTKAAVIFASLAFASGFASFSKTTVDLPLPDQLRVLVAPFHTSLFFDYYLVALYLGAGIAALILALIVASSSSRWRWLWACLVAFAVNFLISWAWPGQEVWLRSTGMLESGALIAAVIFVYLLLRAIRIIEGQSATAERPTVTLLELNLVAVMMLCCLLYSACQQLPKAAMQSANFSLIPGLKVPARFGQPLLKANSAVYTLKESDGASILTISQIESNGRDLKTVMLDLVTQTQAAKLLPNFKVLGAQDYSRYAPSALALEFSYDLLNPNYPGAKVAMSGITVLKLGRQGNTVEYYCMRATPVDMDVRRYDLIRVLQSSN
jgi:hypothetical protein